MRQLNKYKKAALIALAAVMTMTLTVGAATALDSRDSLFAKIRLVFEVVERAHKDGADLEKFVDGAIKGGLEALGDPYTTYFPKQEYSDFIDSLNGTFTGIGAYLELEGQYVVIASPIKGTPANQAGLEPGDRILEVDGTSLVGGSTEKAVKLIRGPAGTQVTLRIERPSVQRSFPVTITRAQIVIPEVESEMKGEIGYIKLASFGDDAAADFFKALASLKAQDAQGLVLDLRQNGGGYLDAAVQIAGGFVPKGDVVVWEVGKQGKTALRSSGRLIGLPAAVLVDKGSASASEVLAGAIQDYGTATLVGATTFGKGTVQNISGLSDGAGVKVTIAEYLTPRQRHVHGLGLTPDVAVENPKPSTERTAPMEYKRDLELSMVGLDVLYLQYRLEDLGYSTETDGFFGFRTDTAVRRYAAEHQLDTGGGVDKVFVESLNKQVAEHLREARQQDAQLDRALEIVKAKLK